ncbi:MAG: hypothetical protein HYW07_16855 [Candidatus Latescibacteria bacterium]|nr:hypothetical protein [Candidatus Latescibacterota bacterium]
MALHPATPWHRASFEHFVQEELPRLLGEHFGLIGYQVRETGTYTFALELVLALGEGEVQVTYSDLPQPDREGVFCIEGQHKVVVPHPSQRDLTQARILCVGEQLADFFRMRLGEIPGELPWDRDKVRTWLPIDSWMREFHQNPTSQYLQTTNWLDRHTHLRRLTLIPIHPEPLDSDQAFPPDQLGLVCPLCTPEGPNMGRLLELARGAQIRHGQLVRLDHSPASHLGFSASVVPFLEHDDTNRALMGINMMRQWMAASDPELPLPARGWFRQYHEQLRRSEGSRPEPALVQTGEEPEAPDFWGGYNLLTAFVMWDGYTYEDGIVISASCAQRLSFPQPVEVGDRLSNRHGSRGVISRILSDEEMPHLTDGAPVDLIFSPTGMISRLNFGQVREALMGRIARAEGRPAVVPPFQAPTADQLQQRLQQAGLPADGMEQLTLQGKRLPHRSTVGWVYWGRLAYTAKERLQTAGGQPLGALGCGALAAAEAWEALHDFLNVGLAAGENAIPASGGIAPTLRFTRLANRLRTAGICAELKGEALHFSFAQSEGVALACPLPHPWLAGQEMKTIGRIEGLDNPSADLREHYEALLQANARLARVLSSQGPELLRQSALAQLQHRLQAFFAALLNAETLRLSAPVPASGCAVMAPGPQLRWDQVGLPEEMAWALFGPQLTHELGAAEPVKKRNKAASAALDALMEKSWVVIHSGQETLVDTPVYYLPPRPVVAFRPVRHTGPALRIHPRACALMEVYFDGDQARVFLPLTPQAQEEVGARLSIAGLLRRDPGLFDLIMRTYHGMMWGLASWGLSAEGRAALAKLTGSEIAGGLLDRSRLTEILRRIFLQAGPEKALALCDRLMDLGFAQCRDSGASFSPFLGAGVTWPAQPAGPDPDLWQVYFEEVAALLSGHVDYADDDLGPLALLVHSGARGNLRQLSQYVAAPVPGPSGSGETLLVRHSLCQGRTAEEVTIKALEALAGLAEANQRGTQVMRSTGEQVWVKDHQILGRALRVQQPGLVFARAADRGEVEPLTGVASRLFVGLPVR